MENFTKHFLYPAGRDQVIKVLGWFSVVGSAVVSTILMVDVLLR